jgi:hypothetical protein
MFPWHEHLQFPLFPTQNLRGKVDISCYHCKQADSTVRYSSVCKMTYRRWDPTACLFMWLLTEFICWRHLG